MFASLKMYASFSVYNFEGKISKFSIRSCHHDKYYSWRREKKMFHYENFQHQALQLRVLLIWTPFFLMLAPLMFTQWIFSLRKVRITYLFFNSSEHLKTRSISYFIIFYFLFQDYPKLSQTYYVLLEYLAQDHMSFLATLEPSVFLYIVSSISEGLTALGANPVSHTGIKSKAFSGTVVIILFHLDYF